MGTVRFQFSPSSPNFVESAPSSETACKQTCRIRQNVRRQLCLGCYWIEWDISGCSGVNAAWLCPPVIRPHTAVNAVLCTQTAIHSFVIHTIPTRSSAHHFAQHTREKKCFQTAPFWHTHTLRKVKSTIVNARNTAETIWICTTIWIQSSAQAKWRAGRPASNCCRHSCSWKRPSLCRRWKKSRRNAPL